MSALLKVEGLRAGYEGIPVVFGIDLEVEEGVTAVLGSNGAGKTTTLRAVSGLLPPMSGRVFFDGGSITGMRAERVARLGLVHVPQGRGIFPSLEVGESLRLAATLAGAKGAEASRRIDEALGTFPVLAERRSQHAGTLSGGEQQMLALARGLIARPRLLMVDEMSQGLAPTIVADLFETLDAFAGHGTAVLLVEQFVSRALAIAEHAYVLEKGTVSFAGPASKLASDSAFVQSSYLGDATVGDDEPTPRAAGPGEEVEIRLPPALLRGLEERAAREGVSLEDLVREVVEREGVATGERRAS